MKKEWGKKNGKDQVREKEIQETPMEGSQEPPKKDFKHAEGRASRNV